MILSVTSYRFAYIAVHYTQCSVLLCSSLTSNTHILYILYYEIHVDNFVKTKSLGLRGMVTTWGIMCVVAVSCWVALWLQTSQYSTVWCQIAMSHTANGCTRRGVHHTKPQCVYKHTWKGDILKAFSPVLLYAYWCNKGPSTAGLVTTRIILWWLSPRLRDDVLQHNQVYLGFFFRAFEMIFLSVSSYNLAFDIFDNHWRF